MKKTAVVVCLHGDEPYGLEIKNRLSKAVPVFVGNPLAIEKKVRYTESDLNRVFPGKEDGNYEQKRACELLKELKEFDCVLDVHSSVCDFGLFAIITKPNEEKIKLAKDMGIKKIVLMGPQLAKGAALIDHVKYGISLEAGNHGKEEVVREVVNLIKNFLENKKVDNGAKIFEIFSIVRGDNESEYFMKNFNPVKKGEVIAKSKNGNGEYHAEFDFVPVFVGENSYKGILCLAAREK